MNILIILAHPDGNSFNHAIARTAYDRLREDGHEVILHDLYAEGFDPILPAPEVQREVDLPPMIAQQCEELSRADGLIFVHPNWWGMPPAILKGWIDRVMRQDIAYCFLEGDGGEGIPKGLLKARTALVFNTSNTSPKREQSVFGDPLETLWKNCILNFCGVTTVVRRMFCVVITSSYGQRALWLEEVGQMVRRNFPPDKTPD